MEKKQLQFKDDQELQDFFEKHPACLGSYDKMLKSYQINRSDILGKGGQGVVYKALEINSQKYVAIKQVPQLIEQFKLNENEIVGEVRTLQKLYVPGLEKLEPRYILRCLGYFLKQDKKEFLGEYDINYMIFLVYPKMQCDLLSLIRGENQKKFTEQNVIIFLIQVIYALQLLQTNYGIQHRDIKPGNILVYKENWYLISDFGSSRFQIDRQKMLQGRTMNNSTFQDTKSIVGTMIYKSPEYKIMYIIENKDILTEFEGIKVSEIINQKENHKSQEKQDVFSIAITAIIMIFPEINAGDLTYLSSNGINIEECLEKVKNQDLKQILQKMSEWDYRKRFSLKECVNFIEKSFKQQIQQINLMFQENQIDPRQSQQNLSLELDIQNTLDFAKQLKQKGLFKEASLEFLKAQENSYHNLGDNNLFYYSSTHDYAWCLHYLGEYEQANLIIQNGISMVEQKIGKQNKIYFRLLIMLATIKERQGEYELSLQLAQEASEYFLKNIPVQKQNYANSLQVMGLAQYRVKQYQKALDITKEAFNLQIELKNEFSFPISRIYNNFGQIYLQLEKIDEAIKFQEKYLVIIEQLYGKQHLQYAGGLHNLGISHQRLKNLDKSQECLTSSLKILEDQLGKQHINTARAYWGLGFNYNHLKDQQNAIFYTKKALAIYKNLYGSSHPETISLQKNLNIYQQSF